MSNPQWQGFTLLGRLSYHFWPVSSLCVDNILGDTTQDRCRASKRCVTCMQATHLSLGFQPHSIILGYSTTHYCRPDWLLHVTSTSTTRQTLQWLPCQNNVNRTHYFVTHHRYRPTHFVTPLGLLLIIIWVSYYLTLYATHTTTLSLIVNYPSGNLRKMKNLKKSRQGYNTLLVSHSLTFSETGPTVLTA